MNAACSLMVADKVKNLTEGVEMASQAIDTGAAASTLQQLIKTSNQGLH